MEVNRVLKKTLTYAEEVIKLIEVHEINEIVTFSSLPEVVIPVKAPRVSKTMLMSLDQLYALPKITPSVESAIFSKEDFSRIQPSYCEKVCKLSAKCTKDVRLLNQKVDILIIQDHQNPTGKFDKRENGQEVIQQSIINFICSKAGFNGLTYRIVNLLKCFPKEIDFPRGKAPRSSTLLKCKPYVLHEIEQCNPKVIISLSTLVTKLIGYPKHSNTNNRGQILDNRVVLSLHPRILTMIRQNAVGSSGMWGADYFEVIRRDFEKASRLVRGELVIPDLVESVKRVVTEHGFKCRSIEDVQTVIDEISSLPENRLVSFDLETNTLDGWEKTAKILCIQFAYKREGASDYKTVVIPLWHKDNTWLNPEEAWKLIVPVLVGPIPKTGWNIKFDMTFIHATKNVKVQNVVFDGLLLNHALDSGVQGTYGLKVAVSDFIPESGLTGYEQLLPPLSRKKKIKVGEVLELDELQEEEKVEDA